MRIALVLALSASILTPLLSGCTAAPKAVAEPRPDYEGARSNAERSQKSLDSETGGD